MSDRSEGNVFNEEIDSRNEMILLHQYKLYVESANLTSRLRGQANTLFLTLNTALVGFVAGLPEFSNRPVTPLWVVFACVAGILVSLAWFFLVRSYHALNSGRFAVIHELETKLPARIYAREWELIMSRSSEKKKYVRQTYVEQVVPLVFCLLYVAMAVSYVVVN